ncbi:MAG: methyltransferase domain-containing protein [Akkermansiaceae bacterium]|nr:methyltransferase domain-containing protein [Akkermansiaceae bacterium]
MSAADTYENERILAEYILFHFGAADQVLPWPEGPRAALGFPARIVDRFAATPCGRGLDLGCAVGRSAFEMSRTCAEVVAIDYSRAFIAAAKRIQSEGRLAIARREEGAVEETVMVALPDGCVADGVQFEQGDAMHLREDLGDFDRVLAANLLCRLTEPGRLLERLPSLVRRGGELVLTTPCTWLEEFTPRDRWPPGSTLAWLREALAPGFELLERHDEPFLIREHARKFQWSMALLTKWRRL